MNRRNPETDRQTLMDTNDLLIEVTHFVAPKMDVTRVNCNALISQLAASKVALYSIPLRVCPSKLLRRQIVGGLNRLSAIIKSMEATLGNAVSQTANETAIMEVMEIISIIDFSTLTSRQAEIYESLELYKPENRALALRKFGTLVALRVAKRNR